MKSRFVPVLLRLIFCTISISPQTKTDKQSQDQIDKPQFGLQAAIFQTVRNGDTELKKNFPITADYKLTPGDIFTLTISSGIKSDGTISSSEEYELQLPDSFVLNVPFVGNVNTKDKKYTELQDFIIKKIRSLMPVQYVNFILKEPAQFHVFIYGGVNLPGYVVVNPLLRVIDAIGMAQGFKTGASYRKVQLIRQKNTTEGKESKTELDISRFYSMADFDSNPSLQPGDKIFVPQAEIVATINGKVKFPGVYELITGETLKTMILLAGGTIPAAKPSIEVVRISDQGEREIITVENESADTFRIKDSDTVTIRSTLENSELIIIEGAVFGGRYSGDSPPSEPEKPKRIPLTYYPGMTLLSTLDAVGGPTSRVISSESYVLKKSSGEKIKIDVAKLWQTRDKNLDMELKPGDYVLLPMEKMLVFVTGKVAKPGSFDFIAGLQVSDYLLQAGGIDEVEGDPNKIYLMQEKGRKKLVKVTDPVHPGDHIHVNKNTLYVTNQFFTNFFIATGWATGIFTLIQTTYNFITFVIGLF
ncbi:MAG: SLBB domain-containing protein [Spirochaetota bacterium]